MYWILKKKKKPIIKKFFKGKLTIIWVYYWNWFHDNA